MRVKTMHAQNRMAKDVKHLQFSGYVKQGHLCLLRWGEWGQAQSACRGTLPPPSLRPRPRRLCPTTTRTRGNPHTAWIPQCGLSPLWRQSLNTAAMDRGVLITQFIEGNIHMCIQTHHTHTHAHTHTPHAHTHMHTHTHHTHTHTHMHTTHTHCG